MATIKELVDKHSKIPGDILVCEMSAAFEVWFRPFFQNDKGDWVGPSKWNSEDVWPEHDNHRIYIEPKQKVKRWLWAYFSSGEWKQHPFYYTDAQVRVSAISQYPFKKLTNTEQEFDE